MNYENSKPAALACSLHQRVASLGFATTLGGVVSEDSMAHEQTLYVHRATLYCSRLPIP